MLDLLWLIPAVPLAGFVLLALLGRRMDRRLCSLVGVGSIGISAILAICVSIAFAQQIGPFGHFRQVLWTWISAGSFRSEVAFYLDPLAVVMILVVTIVSFLIHLYSVRYMRDDEGFSRFFAYMNLFVFAMLTLVLADNLLLLYLGWEGVGLCSFLLIGFWYKDNVNVAAARKAFIVTRVGDTAMLIGLLLILLNSGTLQIQPAVDAARQGWAVSSILATAVAMLLLGGALGKSAQLPLQTWLPDAMAGPTPVSALIHAATMVTAGVYLIARMHGLFELAPGVQLLVAVIGAATLLMAGFSALVQYDIKRVLAYSTISQIGYMFLALGVGAYSAAMLHFMTHAMFKSLLFLAAGAVILACHHEQNMFKLGGLRKRLPLAFWAFMIGSASLSALPLVTAGFYSKDFILAGTYSFEPGGRWLWSAGLAGALLTSLYAFRAVFLTFFGREQVVPSPQRSLFVAIPLVLLSIGALAGGFVELPPTMGDKPWFSQFLSGVFGSPAFPGWAIQGRPEGLSHQSMTSESVLQAVAGAASLAGLLLAYFFFIKKPQAASDLAARMAGLHRFWRLGWGFDQLYDRILVRPWLAIARINRGDIVDTFFDIVAGVGEMLSRLISLTQTGRLRWYAAGIAVGAIVLIALVLL